MDSKWVQMGLGIAVALATPCAASAQAPMSCGFTYQGCLWDAGKPASGDYDLQFNVYDAEFGGSLVAGPLFVDDHVVRRGLFTVELDFGTNCFTGDDRWLEIAVRPADSGGGYTTLSPRQKVTPTAYALLAAGLRLPYLGSVASNTAAFKIQQTGAREAGVFEIANAGNGMTALTGFTDGTGLALQAWTTGTGGAALFDIPVPANPSDVVAAQTVGTGRAGFFEINNHASVANALHARTNGMGYGVWAENVGPGTALMASAQNAPAAEVVTQAGNVPALVATNMGNGVALLANGRIETGRQFVSTLAMGTAPFAVTSTTLNTNLNADMLDGQHLTNLDARFVGQGQANSISSAMIQNGAVNASKLASNIDASSINFNAAKVNGATILMGTWSAGNATPFIALHNGDVQVGGTGSHNDKLRFKNNLGGEVRVSLQAHSDALSSITTVWGGTTVDIPYPHYHPFMVIVSEAASTSNWTTVLWICENDGGGSYLAINHTN